MPSLYWGYRRQRPPHCKKRGKWGASKAGPDCRLIPNHKGECKPMRKKDWFVW